MNEYAPYQQRVLDERKELGVKTQALSKFLDTAVFEKLPLYEQKLLALQFSAMSSYELLLDMRIENFNKEMS